MGIVTTRRYKRLSDFGDPDDYRPGSEMAIVRDDPAPEGGYVHNLTVLFENIGVGEGIPLHIHHTVEEVIVIEAGTAEIRVGLETRRVGPGAVAFVPPGTPHGTRNVGDSILRIQAIFPSPLIDIEMLERAPRPGTEGDPPQPPAAIDLRSDWATPAS
ncbi:MAG TPA: cupin domain-containing protein [Chloroflexia bacterium]|nr:cupin domain-containing protein [Chloroflexia bacterium]